MFASIRQFLMSARGGEFGRRYSLGTGLVFVLVAWNGAAQPAAAQAPPPNWPSPFPKSAITQNVTLRLFPNNSFEIRDLATSQIQFNNVRIWRAQPNYEGELTLSKVGGTFPNDALLVEPAQLGECVLAVPRNEYHVVYGHLVLTGTVTQYYLVTVTP